MKSIYKIIKEEYLRFLIETHNDYDEVAESYFEKENDLKMELFQDFLYKNTPEFTKHVPWKVIPFARLKKIWEDFMLYGHVRDVRGLEMIEDIMIDNTLKVSIFTDLAGHTQWGDEEAFEDNIGYFINLQLDCILPQKQTDLNQLEIPFDNPQSGYSQKQPSPNEPEPCSTEIHPYIQKIFDNNYEEGMDRGKIREVLYEHMKELFYDYYMDDPQHKMGGFISDYGLQLLLILNGQLIRTVKPEDKVVIIDKMLNVIHQRSDIASWFVEGGSESLNQLSGGYHDTEEDSAISGSYKMNDYYQ